MLGVRCHAYVIGMLHSHIVCMLLHVFCTLLHMFYLRCIHVYKRDSCTCKLVRNRESVSCADCGVVGY